MFSRWHIIEPVMFADTDAMVASDEHWRRDFVFYISAARRSPVHRLSEETTRCLLRPRFVKETTGGALVRFSVA